MDRTKGSAFHQRAHPEGSKVLMLVPPSISVVDRALVIISSLVVVGSPVWVPTLYYSLWKRWRSTPKSDKRRRRLYAIVLFGLLAVAVTGPHRSPRVGKFLSVRRWKMWTSWLKFLAFEVITDRPTDGFDMKKDQAILAVIPHGIFPFALAFAALPQAAADTFGSFRVVVATATKLFPLVRTLLSWLGAVDASRSDVDRALSEGSRIGLAPGGIAEMFEGYPKPNTDPNDEYAILKPRKGFVRMAIKHGVPVIPIYCFGATKLLKRVQLPALFENVSKLLRISFCLFFGQWGLPIPFRQRLLYVMGKPIFPPNMEYGLDSPHEGQPQFYHDVDAMHKRFCDELVALFERHKSSYGWDHKELKLI